MVKRYVVITLLVLTLTGCYSHVEGNGIYLPINNLLGAIVYDENPVLVVNKVVEIDLLPNYHLYGTWQFSNQTITFTEDNRIINNYVENGQWYWYTSNIIMTVIDDNIQFVKFEIHDEFILFLINDKIYMGLKI